MYHAVTIPSSQNFPTSNAPRVVLPRKLERPHPANSAHRAPLDTLAPDLADLPIPFIHHQLSLLAARMVAGLDAVSVPHSVPQPLPPTLAVPIPRGTESSDAQRLCPTHVLAVVPPSTPTDAPVSLVTMHGVVLAAHCTAPLLGSVLAPQLPNTARAIMLPICPISLPSLNAFLILRAYMYTARVDSLLDALLPLPALLGHASVKAVLGSRTEIVRLARHIVGVRPGLTHLMGYSTRVREVWQTACCLGMYHTSLWDALDLAWELVLYSLNLAVKDGQEV